MVYSVTWKSGTAALAALGLVGGAVAPIVAPAPAFAQMVFPDVPSNYWASSFINPLVAQGVIAGFPDGTFRPEEPVTRAQFAAMINKAFNRSNVRPPVSFVDVPANYWGRSAIERAYTTGFMAGYPGNVFRPEENIPRAQVLVSLTSGLQYANNQPIDQVLTAFSDAGSIPGYARPGVAAATERRMVVNYPNLQLLNPERVATRAEVAAFIYQALVSTGQSAAIESPYIVGGGQIALRIPAGTQIPLRYVGNDRILLARNEPQPISITLDVAQNVVTTQGQVLIPAGSDVLGQLQATDRGVQFVASELILPNGRKLPMSAVSEFLTATTTINRGASTGRIIAGTIVGAAAGAGVAGVTGDRNIKVEEVLIGAGVGALAGTLFGREQATVFEINPNTGLTVTLTSDLLLQ